MVTPKTYRGMDEEGKEICSCTAVDANSYINPDEVESAIANVRSAAESAMQAASSALSNVAPTAADAVIVKGTDMTATIEASCTALNQVPGALMASIEDMYTEAVSVHDRLQNEANDEAKAAVLGTSGVVNVVE